MGSPPFNVRNATLIGEENGQFAILQGFIPIPIYTHISHFPFGPKACPWADSIDYQRYSNPDLGAYDQAEWLVDALKRPLQSYFNISQKDYDSFKFEPNIYNLGDAVISERFEGVP